MNRVVATALGASKVSLVLRLKSPTAGTVSHLQRPRQCLSDQGQCRLCLEVPHSRFS